MQRLNRRFSVKISELQMLRLKYFQHGEFRIKYSSTCNFRQSMLFQLWNKLEEYERPDIIAFDEKQLLIIEHFGFDGTHEARKGGMVGQRTENELKQAYQRLCKSQTSMNFQVKDIDKKETPEDYIRNLSKHYDAHYKRIPQYINKVIEEKQLQSPQISVGFFIENDFPPIYSVASGEIKMVHLFDTKQFLDLFENSPLLDFVLFGHISGTPELYYIDKSAISYSRENEIDLTEVQFQNFSEMECQGKMKIKL